MALARFVVTADVPSFAWPGGSVATPSVPATTVAVQNTNPGPVQVVITAGTMTAVIINGVTVGAGAGTYTVPPAGTISMTFSVAPTWAWSAVGGTPAGNFLPRIPKGTVIVADSGGGSTPSQVLYTTLNALNGGAGLRAFVQGQDDVGHAGLAN